MAGRCINDGQDVIKGKEMNDLVAVQMGFQTRCQGDKIIQDAGIPKPSGHIILPRETRLSRPT